MGTENALMAAALTPGATVIHNAASEPHVQDLARLLLQMGARVEGIGSNVLIIHGRDQLGGADYRIGPDYIEIGSFVALAAVTGGELRVRDTIPEDLRMTRLVFERLGCRMEFEGNDVVGHMRTLLPRPATDGTIESNGARFFFIELTFRSPADVPRRVVHRLDLPAHVLQVVDPHAHRGQHARRYPLVLADQAEQ